MDALTKRIEIRVTDRGFRLVHEEARARGCSVGQLVREAISRLIEADSAARIRAAEALFGIEGPVADWPDMEREIEAARAGDLR
jgi:hypothetical protein